MSTPEVAAAPQAPQAPQITTTSPTGHTTTLPNSPAAPTTTSPTGHTTTLPNSPAAPTTTSTSNATFMPPSSAAPVPATPDRSADQDDLTYNEQLNAVDRYWKFKMALQIAMIFASIVGIGCLGWALGTANRLPSNWSYGYDSTWSLPWGLITFSISLIWCFICVMRFVVAKHPVHPGMRVTMDLLLWLGFLVTALFTMVALIDLLYWGEDGNLSNSLGYSSSYGDYVLQRNNTWVWETSDSHSGVTYERVCNGSTSYTYYEALPFHSCAEMDAYVNTLWREKGTRARVELTAAITQWLGLLLHFTLFVWACVDCHKYRQSRVSKDAEKLAAGIVRNMVQSGAIVPPQGPPHMRGYAWQQAYQPLPSGADGVSGLGGSGHGAMARPQMGSQGTQQMGSQGMQQMRGPAGPQMMRGQRPISGEQPLPPLPSRPQQQAQAQTQGGPSNGKVPVQDGGVATSYYEPQR
ncbi:uncharacterized protein M421DRAFT_92952 [Didymella exigua CBS 183.55]|uniref:Uncharacterized protein n=1 Tax=Didymella exigua CBS 183.55 TaxID=1150837 RepID=A0A6A5RKM7_9PLEO|nr:uncharacterized protein M421DRAFT_92952 [Didymella exigua CBS 183.55]KAF1927524.1 hypothetical protein M421DRAFT_92952 [Didymella exigua CBS 183.55]